MDGLVQALQASELQPTIITSTAPETLREGLNLTQREGYGNFDQIRGFLGSFESGVCVCVYLLSALR